MRSFILSLLTVILIEPCLAQMVGHNYHSGVVFHFQNQLNGNFDKFITSLEEAGFPVQIKVVPITNEQAHFLMEDIGKHPVWLEIHKDYSTGLVRDKKYVIGPGNGGGGGIAYQVGFMGKQADMLESQTLQEMKFTTHGHNSKQIETGLDNLELMAWKVLAFDNLELATGKILTPDNGYIEQDWEIIPQTGLALPQIKMAQTEFEVIMLEHIKPSVQPEIAYFEDKAVQTFLVSDKTWSYYREHIQAMLQEIVEEAEVDFTDVFYKLDIPAQNGFIYVVGPGNGGGGTYMLYKK